MHVDPFESVIGARVRGVDLGRPLSCALQRELREALSQYAVLVLKRQSLTVSSFAASMRIFGPLERYRPMQIRSPRHATRYLCQDEPDVMRIGNFDVDGHSPAMCTSGSTDWHVDNLYRPAPLRVVGLYAIKVPPVGADTEFASLHHAFAALSEREQRRLEPLDCVYSIERLDALLRRSDPARPALWSQTIADNPPISHPLVRVDPVSGAKSLLFAQSGLSQVVGWGEFESAELIEALTEHATDPRFRYRHRWAAGDLLIWDNLATLHRATPYDRERDKRLLYRATVAGATPHGPRTASAGSDYLVIDKSFTNPTKLSSSRVKLT